jgi:hypothetical protein
VGLGQPKTSPVDVPGTREGCFLCWIFVEAWNSFIRIAAQDVALEWREVAASGSDPN